MKNWHIADERKVMSGEHQALRVIWLAGSSLIGVLLSNDHRKARALTASR